MLDYFATLLDQLPTDDTNIGKFIFAGVFALLVVWLAMIPSHRLQQDKKHIVWWRNVRVWAIFVASIQVVVYLVWG